MSAVEEANVSVVWDERLLGYDFGRAHPFQMRFRGEAAHALGAGGTTGIEPAPEAVLTRFHRAEYLEFLRRAAARPGFGPLDGGDTPSFPACDVAAARVAAATLAGLEAIIKGTNPRAFAPAGGLHHAHPDRASGFCILNDGALAIASALRPVGPYDRVAYVDIDAHHGDGVMYGFYGEGRLLDLDFHQDGRTLFPGTGAVRETGTGDGSGRKVNFPLPPGAGDGTIVPLFERVALPLLREFRPQLLVVQHGVDGHAADPLASLEYSDAAYETVLGGVLDLAREAGAAGVLVTGGAGYDRDAVVRVLTRAGRILGSGPPVTRASVSEEPWVETTVRDLERELGRRFPPVR